MIPIRLIILSTAAAGLFLAMLACAPAAYAKSITLVKVADMSFGKLVFDLSHDGRLQLGSNGVLVVTGTGLSSDFNSTAGYFQVEGRGNPVLEIRCSQTAQLQTAGGQTLNISKIEMAAGAGVSFGSGNRCNGTGGADTPAAVISTSGVSTTNIFIGGEVVIPSGSLPPSDVFNASAGGQPVIFNVVIQ